jgi:5-methylcytosine-specific restriction endonuclease McrA
MPCDYKKYPANWFTEIRPAVLKRAKNHCEICGTSNYTVFTEIKFRDGITVPMIFPAMQTFQRAVDIKRIFGKGKIIVLTIMHLDHDTTNNDMNNLKAACQKCHNRHDVGFRRQNRKIRKNGNI